MIQIRIELVQSLGVELQGTRGHGAVDVHGEYRNALLLFELLDPVDHLFRTADGERRHDELAASSRGVADDGGQPRVFVRAVHAIAVRRFDEQHVGCLNRLRIGKHRPVVASKIAAEQDCLAADTKAGVRRSQQMTGVDELDLDAGCDWDRPVVTHGLQQRQRPRGIERGIERKRRGVLAVSMTIRVTRVLFLNVRGIRQHERAEIARSWRAEDPAAITLRDEARQIATVIEVCVCEHDGIELRRVERQSRPIPKTQVP